jgi:hypothetical protein
MDSVVYWQPHEACSVAILRVVFELFVRLRRPTVVAHVVCRTISPWVTTTGLPARWDRGR